MCCFVFFAKNKPLRLGPVSGETNFSMCGFEMFDFWRDVRKRAFIQREQFIQASQI